MCILILWNYNLKVLSNKLLNWGIDDTCQFLYTSPCYFISILIYVYILLISIYTTIHFYMFLKLMEISTVIHFVIILDIELEIVSQIFYYWISVTHIVICSNIFIITEKWFRLNFISYKLTQFLFNSPYILIPYMKYMA